MREELKFITPGVITFIIGELHSIAIPNLRNEEDMTFIS